MCWHGFSMYLQEMLSVLCVDMSVVVLCPGANMQSKRTNDISFGY
jgi:hypothetical protein